jgi:transforming growth factor-beta-induced protein
VNFHYQRVLTLLLTPLLLLGLVACDSDDGVTDVVVDARGVVAVTQNTANLTTTNSAIIAANLVDTLETEEQQFTILAPINSAYNDLPDGATTRLLQGGNQELLRKLLGYHVISERVTADQLRPGATFTTFGGASLTLPEGFEVVTPDLEAENGLVHGINMVLAGNLDVTDRLVVDGYLTTDDAVSAAELDDDLQAAGPFTIFAPINDAYDALPEGALDVLLDVDHNDGLLEKVLGFHVVPGRITASQVTPGATFTTLEGSTITIGQDFTVVESSSAANGIVHGITQVQTANLDITDQLALRSISSLDAALTASRLDDDLQTDGPFTLFAPTNDALAGVTLTDTTLRRNVLRFHVVPGRITADQLTPGARLTTIAGTELEVSVEQGRTFVDGVAVGEMAIGASNGLIYTLDGVLTDDLNAFDLIRVRGFSTTATRLQAAGLDDDLATLTGFTLFAPTNTAFSSVIGADTLAAARNATGLLAEVLQYHVVPQRLTLSQLTNGQTLTTLAGETLTIRVSGDSVLVNNTLVGAGNLRASNGIVHTLNGVLTGSLELPETARLLGLRSLTGALRQAGLISTLEDDGPFTLFAPTNAGFGKVAADTLLSDEQDEVLGRVLRYHVVRGRILAENITDGQTVTALDGTTLTFQVNDAGDVSVNRVPLARADVMSSNGVVHTIDDVLTDNLNIVPLTLVRGLTAFPLAVEETGLDSRLDGAGPFTVFAPTDAAFDSLIVADSDSTLTLRGLLGRSGTADVLRYHVLNGRTFASQLVDGQELMTLEGSMLTVRITGSGTGQVIRLISETEGNVATLTRRDLRAANGVVHFIDRVLIPSDN